MALSFNRYLMLFVITGIFSSVSVQANTDFSNDANYLSIKNMEVREIHVGPLGINSYEVISEKDISYPQGLPDSSGRVDPTEKVGKVISVARDLVAFGEELYRLVIKGKPSNATTYAPISVIPRINGVNVDILDTDTWKAPVKRTYEVIYKNFYRMDVVTFRYSVMYSYGGSYDGKGAYLTAVQIIPESVRTMFGYDFTATMKLGGLQNQGTRANPIAAATILMEYTVSTVLVASNEVRSFFITGNGGFQKL
jgi:hypothetical protein